MVSEAPPIGSSLSDVFYFCLLLLYQRYLLVIMVLVNLLLLKSYLCLTLFTGFIDIRLPLFLRLGY